MDEYIHERVAHCGPSINSFYQAAEHWCFSDPSCLCASRLFSPHPQQPIMLSCRNVIWAKNWTETGFQVTGGGGKAAPCISNGPQRTGSPFQGWLESLSITEMVKLMMRLGDREARADPLNVTFVISQAHTKNCLPSQRPCCYCSASGWRDFFPPNPYHTHGVSSAGAGDEMAQDA